MSELKTLGSFRAKQAVGCSLSELMALRYMRGAVRTYSGKSEGISTKMRTEMKKPKIQGNPERMSAEDLRGLTEADWLSLLDHKPNDEGIVAQCDKWLSFNVDDLCALLCRHPQLGKSCPDGVWSKFKGGHWARLVIAGRDFRSFEGNDKDVHSFYVDKMTALGLDKTMIGDWCCMWHWAEHYATCFAVRCAAAASDEEKIRRIAHESAINPEQMGPGLGNGVAHIKWLASIAKDCAEMAAMTDEAHAREYALIAQAANLQAQKADAARP